MLMKVKISFPNNRNTKPIGVRIPKNVTITHDVCLGYYSCQPYIVQEVTGMLSNSPTSKEYGQEYEQLIYFGRSNEETNAFYDDWYSIREWPDYDIKQGESISEIDQIFGTDEQRYNLNRYDLLIEENNCKFLAF